MQRHPHFRVYAPFRQNRFASPGTSEGGGGGRARARARLMTHLRKWRRVECIYKQIPLTEDGTVS